MDASRFNRLSRHVAATATRRAAVGGLAALLGRRLVSPTETAAPPEVCRPLGANCFPEHGLDCCQGICRDGRCHCGAGRKRRQGRCIAKQACCGGCPEGQVCRHGGCCVCSLKPPARPRKI